jgi:hypothetical protein
MPKIVLPPAPLSGLFGIHKPSGPTSMSVINDVKQLVARSSLFVEAEKLTATKGSRLPNRRRMREAVKIGQGGTLDPLADGVLGENHQSAEITCTLPPLLLLSVVGVGRGTKRLTEFLDCTKVSTKRHTSKLTFNLTDRNIIPLVCWAARRTHMTMRVLESALRRGDMLHANRLNLSCLSFWARFNKHPQCLFSRTHGE